MILTDSIPPKWSEITDPNLQTCSNKHPLVHQKGLLLNVGGNRCVTKHLQVDRLRVSISPKQVLARDPHIISILRDPQTKQHSRDITHLISIKTRTQKNCTVFLITQRSREIKGSYPGFSMQTQISHLPRDGELIINDHVKIKRGTTLR